MKLAILLLENAALADSNILDTEGFVLFTQA